MSPSPGGGASRFGGARDVAALLSNAASLAVVAVAGIGVSSMLAGRFGVSAVGQFNQLAMLHIVLAQVAAMGVHLSCLHFLSADGLDRSARAAGAQAAMAVAALAGTAVGLALFLGAPLWEHAFDSPGLALGVRWLAPAVALFGINKVMLALLNCSERLHAYALLQVSRPLVWLTGCMAIVRGGVASPDRLGILLFFGEVVAIFLGVLMLAPLLFRRPDFSAGGSWANKHFAFGWRAMPSHLVIDLNTRIDVLVLSVFLPAATVGVYSFAALLAEGVFQIGVLVRTVITSRLVQALLAGDQPALTSLRHSAGRASLGLTMLAGLVLLVGFDHVVVLLGLDSALLGGIGPLVVLLAGVVACARLSPFWMAVALAGHPAEHSRLMLALCVLNVAANMALIPPFGMMGAAAGTALMFMAFPFMLRWAVRRSAGLAL